MIMPRFYFQRRQKSDRGWVEMRMGLIPKEYQQSVADEYERIFMSKGVGIKARREANEYLLEVSDGYRRAGNEQD